jgi:hypothetical protein
MRHSTVFCVFMILSNQLFGQIVSGITDEYSGLYRGIVHAKAFCETDEVEAHIYIKVSSEHSFFIQDGIRYSMDGFDGDSVYYFGDFSVGYFDKDKSGNVIFHYNGGLEWFHNDELGYRPHDWIKVSALDEAADVLDRFYKREDEFDAFWDTFLAALSAKDIKALSTMINKELYMYNYDAEGDEEEDEYILVENPAKYILEVMEENQSVLWSMIQYSYEDLEDIEAPKEWDNSMYGTPTYFGDNDPCFPESYLLSEAPRVLYFKKVDGVYKVVNVY